MSTATVMTYRVPVRRDRRVQEALKATGYYVPLVVNEETMLSAPKGIDSVVELTLFNPHRQDLSDNELLEEYIQRGLPPADLYSLAALNETYPDLAVTHPNATHWRNEKGIWCWAGFHTNEWCHAVIIKPANGERWSKKWWFVGISK